MHPNIDYQKRRGVFKFQHAGKVYYRYGRDLNKAILSLARELRVEVIYVEILEGGKPQ